MQPDLSNQFQALRSQIEAVLKQHSVIAITSAESGDGKSLTAFGIAAHMTKAGHRCMLVDGNTVERSAQTLGSHLDRTKNGAQRTSSARTISGFSEMQLADEAPGPLSRAAVKALFSQLREAYDFAIVDCGVMTINDNALGLCAAADAVLITVRAGRPKRAADQHLVRQLNQSVSTVMGIVHIAPSAIEDFSRVPAPVSDSETSTSFRSAPEENVRGIACV
jgi:receptor protein-tyrosine kinase